MFLTTEVTGFAIMSDCGELNMFTKEIKSEGESKFAAMVNTE